MIKAIAISGSLRQASSNTGLLRHAQTVLPPGMSLELVDIRGVPLFNQDTADQGRPLAVDAVLKRIADADALVLAAPEYNYSVAPALKNVLDWASREPDNRLLDGKPVAIMGAGSGMGTSRAQYHLRQICVVLNLLPINKPGFCKRLWRWLRRRRQSARPGDRRQIAPADGGAAGLDLASARPPAAARESSLSAK